MNGPPLRIATLPVLLTLAVFAQSEAEKMPTPFAIASGPIELTAKPVAVTLRPTSGTKALLAQRLTALAPDQHMLLVLHDVMSEQPPGVVYGVYLGTAIDDAHNVGYINFFNPQTAPRTLDITGVARKLRSRNQLADPTIVTIAPRGQPADHAKPVISRIELVAQ